MFQHYFKITLLALLGLHLSACDITGGTPAGLYRLGLQLGLGTDDIKWAEFAETGRLGSCILAKPPMTDAGGSPNPFYDKCEYYFRTGVTNSQGLKGYLGGVGCIPKAGSPMWGHTFITKNQSSAPANIKNWVGGKVRALVLGDTTDNVCQLGTFITANSNRLSLFDQIDFQTQEQLSHLVWTSPDVCGFRMPEMFPLWNSATNSTQCYTPILTGGSQPFCKIAYNRYVNLNGGVPPTFISTTEMQNGSNYQAAGLVTNADLISSLHSKFMGIEAVPELTDLVIKNADGSEWNGTFPGNGTDGFDAYSRNIVWSTFYNGFNVSTHDYKTIGETFMPPKLTQAMLSAGVLCAMNGWTGWCVGHGSASGGTPAIHSDSASNPVSASIVPPSSTYINSLVSYSMTSPPGIVGVPIDILNGLYVTHSYSSGYKLKSDNPTSYFFTARSISNVSVACPVPPTWSASVGAIQTVPQTSLSSPLVTNPVNWH